MRTSNTISHNIETGLKLIFLPLIAVGVISLIYALLSGHVDPVCLAGVPALLTQNSKLKKTSLLSGYNVYNFGIPAYKSETGKSTCPFAETCVSFCYAQKGAYIWSNVTPAFEYRLKVTLQDSFKDTMLRYLEKKRSLDVVRIHDSGDFYSPAYLEKWYQIMESRPDLFFYAYTNSMPFFRPMRKRSEGWEITGPDYARPDNFDVIFSTGGKFAHLRKETDRRTHIFQNKRDLEIAGYIDASKNDLFATRLLNPDNNKIGLIYH